MGEIELADGHATLEAALIAADFGLDAPGVLEAMRTGQLKSVWERGVGNDAGRHRVTFFHQNRQLRLIVDGNGQILERSLGSSVHVAAEFFNIENRHLLREQLDETLIAQGP